MSQRRSSFNAGGIFIYLLSCVVIGVLIFYFTENFEQRSGQVLNNTQANPDVKAVSIQPAPSPSQAASPLEQVIQKALEGSKGDYAVAIKNLKTGEEFYLNENKSYDSGSLYKLWVMGETYRKLEQGELMGEDVLSSSIPELNSIFEIDPSEAELKSGEISMTVNLALNQMITISHNYAALLLTQKNKLSTIREWLSQEGFTGSTVGENRQTTALDILKFFDKLQSGELGNQESTEKMLTLLKNQKLVKKLPANLPKDIEIAHKTGEYGLFTHDAGIVYSEKGDYIIVVMSESEMPAAAEKRIAEISRVVYEYFQK